MWVADRGNNRVDIFSGEGKFLGCFGNGKGREYQEQMNAPVGRGGTGQGGERVCAGWIEQPGAENSGRKAAK